MPNKRKVSLFDKKLAKSTKYKGKNGKFIGCCPNCKLTLASWEKINESKVKCSRCESVMLIKSLKPYKSVNNEFGL